MSKFFSEKFADLIPYVPGEQPKDMKYIKLNTNESPFAPSCLAQQYAADAAKKLQLYPDPDCTELREKIASFNCRSTNEPTINIAKNIPIAI